MGRALAIVIALILVAAGVIVVAMGRGGDDAPAEGDVRIVVLSPALAVTLVDLGLESHIVGRHGFDYVLDKDVPVCGDQAGIDFESLVEARPTHVLTEWGRRPLPDRLIGLADEQGWVVRNVELLSLEQVAASVVEMATLFDGWIDARRPALEEAPDAEAQEMVERMVPRRERAFEGRVLLLWPTNPPAAVGPGSFHHEVLERVGGVPAIESGSAYIELDAESVLSLAPDGIIVISPRGVGEAPASVEWPDVEALLGVVATLEVPAISDRRVAVIDDPLALTPSTAMIDFGREVRAILEAWSRE